MTELRISHKGHNTGPWLLFAGMQYYPDGGAYDYRGQYTDLESALQAATQTTADPWADGGAEWAHVLNLTTGQMLDSTGKILEAS